MGKGKPKLYRGHGNHGGWLTIRLIELKMKRKNITNPSKNYNSTNLKNLLFLDTIRTPSNGRKNIFKKTYEKI